MAISEMTGRGICIAFHSHINVFTTIITTTVSVAKEYDISLQSVKCELPSSLFLFFSFNFYALHSGPTIRHFFFLVLQSQKKMPVTVNSVAENSIWVRHRQCQGKLKFQKNPVHPDAQALLYRYIISWHPGFCVGCGSHLYPVLDQGKIVNMYLCKCIFLYRQ